MRLRPLRRADAPAILAMWNATARFDSLTPGLLEEKTWSDPDFDPGLALVCEDSGSLTGFAMGVLRDGEMGPRGVIKLLAAAADRRRQGIGSRLLKALEDELAARGAETLRVCESAPNYLTPGVDARYSAAPHFFEKHGYERLGEACNMTVDLASRDFDTAGAERDLAGRGFTIRRAKPADREAVYALLDAWWPSWKPEVGQALGNRPASLHLAFQGDEAVAFSAHDANNRGTGWFGPMGTAPAARKQGIGRLLLFRCLGDMAAGGRSQAIIPWVDPVDFYRACTGAAVSRIFHRYEKVLEP